MSRKDLDELRTGWDLVLDIDCPILDYSKICGDLIVKFLEYCGVKDVSCKFSGNKGFHIGVPFESFPKMVGETETRLLFPEAAKKIAFYIKENIAQELGKRILAFENNSFNAVKQKVNLEQDEIIKFENDNQGNKIAKLNPDKFLEIDTVLISSRHLYRMPYSLHEKSGLVSLPIDPHEIMNFEKPMAKPENLHISLFGFLDRNVTGESSRRLLIQALDFDVKTEEEKDYSDKKFEELKFESPINPQFFPPCIKLLLNGVEDGKKRAIFCMINFLGKLGWNKQEIEIFLQTWNKQKNAEPLREVYIKGQLNHFKANEKLPPNCNNEAYYLDLGVCKPDGLCKKIKNPVNYTTIRWKRHMQDLAEDKEYQKHMKHLEKMKEEKIKKEKNQVKVKKNDKGDDNIDKKSKKREKNIKSEEKEKEKMFKENKDT
jgi:hypothetical protein